MMLTIAGSLLIYQGVFGQRSCGTRKVHNRLPLKVESQRIGAIR